LLCTVETPLTACDDPAGIRVSLPGPGYIANLVTEATGCGGVNSPWRIEAQPGQTIRLSLLHFSLAPPSRRRCLATPTALPGDTAAAAARGGARCPPLAVVREPVSSDWLNVTVARPPQGGATATSRENLVYVSQGHVVQVAILTSENSADVPFFMVKYEGEIPFPST